MERAEANHLSMLSHDVIENELRPAYHRLSQTLATLAENAPVQAGIWAQPGGHETYQRLLNWHISGVQPLDDLHQANMDEVTAMRTRFETALNTWGLEPAPLGDRLTGLANLLAAEARAEEVPPQAASIVATKRPLSPSSLTGYVFLPARLDGRRPAVVIASDPAIAIWPSYVRPALQLDSDIGLRQPFVNMGRQRRSPARALSPYPSVLDAWQIYTAETHLEDAPDITRGTIGPAPTPFTVCRNGCRRHGSAS